MEVFIFPKGPMDLTPLGSGSQCSKTPFCFDPSGFLMGNWLKRKKSCQRVRINKFVHNQHNCSLPLHVFYCLVNETNESRSPKTEKVKGVNNPVYSNSWEGRLAIWVAKSPFSGLILWARLNGGVYFPQRANGFEPVLLPGMGAWRSICFQNENIHDSIGWDGSIPISEAE